MAGEYCGLGCGHCGRCDAADGPACSYCERDDCDGTCDEYYTEINRWMESVPTAELDARADAFVHEIQARVA